MQNVIVLGGSYGGAHAAHLLAQALGNEYRVIMIDRNTHANHLYVLPRLGVLGGHEHKAFVPYRVFHCDADGNASASSSSAEPPRHLVLKAHVNALSPDSVMLDRAFPEHGLPSSTIPFKYCIYALGSRMPIPIDLWSDDPNAVTRQLVKPTTPVSEKRVESVYDGTKEQAIEWLKRCQERIRRAGSVLCVGGGALGIQFAADIKSLYPEKQVTLLHSRHRLLPRFDYEMHTEILKTMEDLGVDLILGERLDVASTEPENVKFNARGQRVVRTLSGREVAADLLLLCTGQTPNTDMITHMSPGSVDPETKLAYVLPTLQLGIRPSAQRPVDVPLPSSPVPPAVTELSSLPVSELAPVAEPASTLPECEEEDEDAYATEAEAEQEPLPPTPYPNIFVIGDAADAFGAIKAGHTAYWQAEVAVRNIVRLVEHEAQEVHVAEAGAQEPLVLERYEPGPPGIKVSLGVGSKALYQINGVVGRKDRADPDDLDAILIWSCFGWPQSVNEEDTYL